MDRKNKKMLVGILGLLILNLLLLGRSANSGSGIDETMFAIQDTSTVSSIQIGDILLEKKKDWTLGEYKVDPAFMDHLLNVLLRVRVKKPIGTLTDSGIPIEIDGNDSFTLVSNNTKTKTFFVRDGKAFEVEIPGFTDYLGGIFELEKDQWRDRLVYDGSSRTIQKLDFNYLEGDDEDFTIQFENDFFKISGVSQMDTTVMIRYLNQFEYFQANERISEGRIPSMDSLASTEPMAELAINDINYDKPVSFKIFPRRAQDGFHLVIDPQGEMIAIDARRIAQILQKREDFQFKK